MTKTIKISSDSRSDDSTISLPSEVTLNDDGSVLAVHEGEPDKAFKSLGAFEDAYRFAIEGFDMF